MAVPKKRKERALIGLVPLESKSVNILIDKAYDASKVFATYSQEEVDKIFKNVAIAANQSRISFAKLAVEETGKGVWEDKIIKNHFASEYIYNKFKNVKTCGIIETDESKGLQKIAVPKGLIVALISEASPTSSVIFEILIALKTRNSLIISPHPNARKSTIEAAKVLYNAAIEAGAPYDIISWIENPTSMSTQQLMKHQNVSVVIASGSLDESYARQSGKQVINIGMGNMPALIDESANIPVVVNSILKGKIFDNGLLCSSEQSVIVVNSVYETVKKEFVNQGAHFLNKKEQKKLEEACFKDGKFNSKIAGLSANKLAELAAFKLNKTEQVLVAEVEKIGAEEPLSSEKLSPIITMYKAVDYLDGIQKAKKLTECGKYGNIAAFYTEEHNKERINEFSEAVDSGRVLVNIPSFHGTVGDLYNYRLEPSFAMGCSFSGKGFVSEDVSLNHLMNIKTVVRSRESAFGYKVPPKLYFGKACLHSALQELQGSKRAFIVTDEPIRALDYVEKITSVLDELKIKSEIFSAVEPNPKLTNIEHGVKAMNVFKPDVVISIGGGSPIDAAKIMWLLYENPDQKFENLAMNFMDVQKRIYEFSRPSKKALFVAVPTTSGTGAEVTPFAVITNDKTGQKYPLADYSLIPDMAIIDYELVLEMPPKLTAYSGLDALSHVMETYVATFANEFTDGQALETLDLIFEYLSISYREGAKNELAKKKMHYASTLAGLAFANSFLGICHSLAHKLGAEFDIPHGLANAIMLPAVIRYNSESKPLRQIIDYENDQPCAKRRYAQMAEYLRLGGKTDDEKVENLLSAIEKLKKDLEVPMRVRDLGIDKEEYFSKVNLLAENAFDDQCTIANPRFPLIEEMAELYKSVW